VPTNEKLPSTIPPEFAFPGRANRPSKHQHARSGLYIKSEHGRKLRDRKTSRMVEKMRSVMPWLEDSDVPACRAWAQLEIMADTCHAILRRAGVTNTQGEPRRLLQDFTRLRSIQLQYAKELAMTPASRMAIKANGTRAPLDLALAMQQGAEEEEVVE
jgi:hypothetical protein